MRVTGRVTSIGQDGKLYVAVDTDTTAADGSTGIERGFLCGEVASVELLPEAPGKAATVVEGMNDGLG